MGKYSHLVGVLPKLALEDDEDPKYQEKVNLRKDLILNGPEDPEKTLAREVFDTWTQEQKLEELRKRMKNIVNDTMVVNLVLSSLTSKKPKSPAALASAYRECRFVKDALNVEEKDLNLTVKAYEQLMAEAYENEGITSLKLSDTGAGQHLIVSSPEPGVKVRNREDFRLWCIKEGLQSQMHLHPSTAKSMVKERLLKGMPDPDGVEVGMTNKVTMRKA